MEISALDPDPDAGLAAQVCKTGGPLPFSKTLKNVVILGDSVSIGYTPFVKTALKDVALLQHSPWGGDGGVEETEYGWRCLEYLLRAPNGTPQIPDVLFFNWGLHNLNVVPNSTDPTKDVVPGQSGPASAYEPFLRKIAARLLQLGDRTKLIFGMTTPWLNDAAKDSVVQKVPLPCLIASSSPAWLIICFKIEILQLCTFKRERKREKES
jgi:hypothetical protein